MDNIKLANLLFPNAKEVSFYEDKYNNRNLQDKEVVTRFAPSPTGFLHIGGLFSALVNYLLVKKNGGKFCLRLEDTDQKRKVEGADTLILKIFNEFGITFDEGVTLDGGEKGEYGPYIQSQRKEIYQAYAKKLVAEGLAYPCFCTEDDEKEIEEEQTRDNTQKRGYYGKYAKCRNLTYEQIEERIKNGQQFAIRLKCQKQEGDRFKFKDLIKGEIEMDANINDAVILKSDGIPPYNFAHAIDDHLMQTSIVVRGEDWLSATSEHSQIFEALGFNKIPYAHLPQLEKLDGASRRKLSKRKDPEANALLFFEKGYPKEAVIDYLMTIINSNFELWRANNRHESFENFDFSLSKMSKSGSLFDMVKLADVSKNVIAYKSIDELKQDINAYASKYDEELSKLLQAQGGRLFELLSIDRGGEKPRKDIAKYSDIIQTYGYIFDDVFYSYKKENFEFDFDKFTASQIQEVATHYKGIYSSADDSKEWFTRIKENIESLGFASDMKQYKQTPENYKGSIADYTTIIRVLLTGKKNTPDLASIIKILGQDEMEKRFNFALQLIQK